MSERFLFVRPDSYGDLVLFEPVIRLLRQSKSDCGIYVVIRKAYMDMTSLIPGADRWLAVDVNPYSNSPDRYHEELIQLKASLDEIEPDIVIAPLFNKTWLEVIIASWFPHARKISLGAVDLDGVTSSQLKRDFQIDSRTVFSEYIEVPAAMPELEKNLVLVSAICSASIADPKPRLLLTEKAKIKAEAVLIGLGLINGYWVACCPAGVANVSIKKWPAEKYAEVVAWLKNEKNLDVCLLGRADEKCILDAVQEKSCTYGYRPAIWVGNDGDIPLLSGLLSKSEFYFGNDTGAMHIAGALSRPVVAVYGGGTWPRFKTVADSSISIVQKLPCFGCNWKCHYVTAPCIESISVEKVTRLLSERIEHRSIQGHCEVDIQEFSDASIEIIRNGAFTVQNLRIESSALRLQVATLTDQLKESELDRGLRFEQIQELTDQLKESELDRGLRFEQIQELTELLKESEADRTERLKRIHQLETRLDSVVRRLDRVERTYRALESTFVVRKARLLRLISVGCIADPHEHGEKAIL